MYSKTGNYSYPVSSDVSRGTVLQLSSDELNFVVASSTDAPNFIALADTESGLPCAALSVSSAPGGAEVRAVAGTYTRGAAVYSAGDGTVTSTESGDPLGYYLGETVTLSEETLIEIVFA